MGSVRGLLRRAVLGVVVGGQCPPPAGQGISGVAGLGGAGCALRWLAVVCGLRAGLIHGLEPGI